MRFQISEHGKRHLLMRLGITLPFFVALPGLLLWLYIVKPWPNVSRDGAVAYAMLTIVFALVLGASIRYLWQAFHGAYDIVFSADSVTLPRVGARSRDQVEFVGAFKLPLFPRRALLRVKRERPTIFRRTMKPLLVEIGYYKDADELEERLIDFSQGTRRV